MPKFSTIALSLSLILSFVIADTCHPGAVRDCLARFESVYAWCGEDENCMCDAIVTTGAMCYSDCPDSAIDQFIETYDNGRCKSYNRYPSPIPEPTASASTLTPSFTSSSSPSATSSASKPINTHDTRFADRARSWFGLSRRQAMVHDDVDNDYFEEDMLDQADELETFERANATLSITSVVPTAPVKTSWTAAPILSPSPTTEHHSRTTSQAHPHTSLSPAEQALSIIRQREKENLRSIRASRASESSAALAAALVAKTAAPAAPAQATAMENRVKIAEKTTAALVSSGSNDVLVGTSAGLAGGLVLLALNAPMRVLVGSAALYSILLYSLT